VQDVTRAAETRVQAFTVIAPRSYSIGEPAFAFMMSQLKGDRPPLLRLAAANGLGQASLTEGQLRKLTSIVAGAGPLELPALLPAFENSPYSDVGQALLAALEKNKSLVSLTPAALAKAVQKCPDHVRRAPTSLPSA